MNAPSCLFVLIHVYVHICNLWRVSINNFCFISAYCVKYTKAYFTEPFEIFVVCMLKLRGWIM